MAFPQTESFLTAKEATKTIRKSIYTVGNIFVCYSSVTYSCPRTFTGTNVSTTINLNQRWAIHLNSFQKKTYNQSLDI